MFSHSDAVLFYARKWGCKITVPIINQDYGSQESNFNGNWADLIRLYYDLPDYNATLSYDFWTDPNLINAFVRSSLTARENVDREQDEEAVHQVLDTQQHPHGRRVWSR